MSTANSPVPGPQPPSEVGIVVTRIALEASLQLVSDGHSLCDRYQEATEAAEATGLFVVHGGQRPSSFIAELNRCLRKLTRLNQRLDELIAGGTVPKTAVRPLRRAVRRLARLLGRTGIGLHTDDSQLLMAARSLLRTIDEVYRTAEGLVCQAHTLLSYLDAYYFDGSVTAWTAHRVAAARQANLVLLHRADPQYARIPVPRAGRAT